MSGFEVGKGAVCVKDATAFDLAFSRGALPVKGKTYTINAITTDCWGNLMLHLDGLPSEETEFVNAGFLASGFRPVIERKTDISIFKRMLTPSELERV